jgi:hypothetical protein
VKGRQGAEARSGGQEHVIDWGTLQVSWSGLFQQKGTPR